MNTDEEYIDHLHCEVEQLQADVKALEENLKMADAVNQGLRAKIAELEITLQTSGNATDRLAHYADDLEDRLNIPHTTKY